ncbi:unnamed protein product [Rhizoctonia solani]|nr:unnamed protein product [Rhizoctonia solani]
MQLYKSTYGPQGLSCLTCRQRRKKCDRTRPVCKRCIKGQFRCLGYDNDPPEALLAECQLTQTAERLDPANVSSGPREMPIQVRSAEVQSGNILVSSPTFIFGSLDENPGATPSHGSSAHLGSFDRSGIAITSTGILELSPQSHRGSKDLPDMNELEAFNQTWPQEQSQCLVRTRTFDPGTTRSYSTFRLNIPRAVNANAQMRGDYFTFILSEYEIHRLRKFFKPPPMPLSSGLAARMKRSNTILGFMYLGAKVFEALSGRPIDAVWKCCKRWIASFDRQLTNHSPWRPSIKESEDRLTGLLELAYLTFLVVDTVAGYALIKRALPLFLHLVSNDLELCSERSGQLVVSLPRALLTSRYEIKRFVFYDMMCALVLGVMPLAEYDPGEPLVVMYPPLPTEVFHGIPIEWILIIGHIWARTSDWRNLETQILSWGPRISDIWSEESIELVFRIAIQESWRHAILVYIYMAQCVRGRFARSTRTSFGKTNCPADGSRSRSSHGCAPLYAVHYSTKQSQLKLHSCFGHLKPVSRHLFHNSTLLSARRLSMIFGNPALLESVYPARLHTAKTVEKLLGFLPDADRVKTQVLILSGSTTPFRNDTDRELPLRQESNFFYLTGCDIVNSHVMITVSPPNTASNSPQIKSTLFIPREDPLETMWSPPPPTLETARSTHESDAIAHSDEFEMHVAGAIKPGETIVHILPQTAQFPNLPVVLIAALSTSGVTPPPMIKYLLPALHSARLIKTDYELELIRKANAISSRAHEVIMRVLGKDMKEVGGRVDTGEVTSAVMPGQWRIQKEAEGEAIFVASCRREGAHQAYMPIVASAQHAATLHYCCNDRPFAWGPVNSDRQDLATQPENGSAHVHNGTQNEHEDGATLAPQVLLLDAGCEWRNYASDITRTTPVGNGGKFTPEARAIYELVLRMQEEAIDLLKPGVHWDAIQLQCHSTLIDGFLELGIFKGEKSDILKSEISSAFFPHGVGHSLGLDVHDVPSASKPEAVTKSSSLLALGPNVTIPIESADHPSFYRYLRLRLPLAAGMVLTVEPGIYFSPHLLAPVRSSPLIDHEVLARYESVGGVRIEDVLWITETGCQNFTVVGKSVEWIEKLSSGNA